MRTVKNAAIINQSRRVRAAIKLPFLKMREQKSRNGYLHKPRDDSRIIKKNFCFLFVYVMDLSRLTEDNYECLGAAQRSSFFRIE